MLAAAEADDDDEKLKQSEFHKKQIEHNRQLKDMQARRAAVKEAEMATLIHFDEDDLNPEENNI